MLAAATAAAIEMAHLQDMLMNPKDVASLIIISGDIIDPKM